jgi:predicted nucleic acid-binding protein
MSANRRRVVFDTSTLVSAAILPESTPGKALERAFRDCKLCASSDTHAELRDVLSRDRFDRYRSPELRDEFYRFVADASKLPSWSKSPTAATRRTTSSYRLHSQPAPIAS